MKTKALPFFLLPFLLSYTLRSQIKWEDNFQDTSYHLSSFWLGDTGKFMVNPQLQLQLNDQSANDPAFLSRPSPIIDQASWELEIHLDFSPSTSNFLEIFLCSDQINPLFASEAYFIRVGGISGDQDDVSLYRRKNGIDTEIIDGLDGLAGGNSVTLRIKVERDSTKRWNLYTDLDTSGSYLLEGSVIDSLVQESAYFSFLCHYTSSRSDKFFFDNLKVEGYPYQDRIPIECDSLRLIDSNSLALFLSELPEDSSAMRPQHYRLLPSDIHPDSIAYHFEDSSKILLFFEKAFPELIDLGIEISNLEDRSGNRILSDTLGFNFYRSYTPVFHDLLINEFFPDPSPSQGLPEHEFIEIYNRSKTYYNLVNWTISDAGNPKVLGDHWLLPGEYLILCDEDDSLFFQEWGTTLGVKNFPALNNGGDEIILRDPAGNVIDELRYDLEWYGSAQKSSGGWSIELSNPFDDCNKQQNYRASISPDGGSPGIQNSIFDTLPDLLPPELIELEFPSTDSIRLSFSEKLDSTSVYQAQYSLTFNQQAYAIDTIFFKEIPSEIILKLSANVDSGAYGNLVIVGLSDCSGNRNTEITQKIALPARAKYREVVINEFLVRESPSIGLAEEEYIELFNASDKVFDLKDWQLADLNRSRSLPSFLLYPGEFLLLHPTQGGSAYQQFSNALALSSYPTFNQSGDQIKLFNADLVKIDHLSYDQNWFTGEAEEGGRSLEQINPYLNCSGLYNYVVSTHPSGGSPLAENSVFDAAEDQQAPILIHLQVVTEDSLLSYWNEGIDSNRLAEIQLKYQSDEMEVLAHSYHPDYAKLGIKLPFALDSGLLYPFYFEAVFDCQGNASENQEAVQTVLPFTASKQDVVINELLFNPFPGGVDFVEVYNRSDKILDLSEWRVNNELNYEEAVVIQEVGRPFFPKAYSFIAEDLNIIKQHYYESDLSVGIKNELPSFNDDEGKVYLFNSRGLLIDAFEYNEAMHFSLLRDEEGVSLERIDPDAPSAGSNFFSASEAIGFASPGKENSQYSQGSQRKANFKLRSKFVSPDGDGYEDLLIVDYLFEKEGYVGKLSVLDREGREMAIISREKLLSRSGSFNWDGIDQHGSRIDLGIYLLLAEIFHPDGERKIFKLPFAVAGKVK